MDTPYHYGGGGAGFLNKWFFIKKSMFKYGGIIFEIMERYCNTLRLRCRSILLLGDLKVCSSEKIFKK